MFPFLFPYVAERQGISLKHYPPRQRQHFNSDLGYAAHDKIPMQLLRVGLISPVLNSALLDLWIHSDALEE